MGSRNQILNDPETAMRTALEGNQSQIWTAFPAIVSAVNYTSETLECTPAIKGVQTNPNGFQQYVTLPQLVDVPICFPSAGGFSLTLPIAAGDEILIVIANRCIDSWWQLGGIQIPMEFRMHDLSDGFAIPGPRSKPKVITGGINTDNAQLRTDDGTCMLEITPDGKINMLAPGGVKITGNLDVTGEVTAKKGTTNVTLSTHVHGGVATGSGSTGGPVG